MRYDQTSKTTTPKTSDFTFFPRNTCIINIRSISCVQFEQTLRNWKSDRETNRTW
jgi:hypothetical protein